MLEAPHTAVQAGFSNGPGGTHTSRTMMLEELRMLLAARPATALLQEYQAAVVDDNVLRKDTLTTRKRTLKGLRELYRLDTRVLLFRALRDLWDADPLAQPLLALLCAVARDRLLRASAPLILGASPGDVITPQMLSQAIGAALPDRYNAGTLGKIGRNLASSWQQSGHLAGRAKKVRTRAVTRPTAVAYALLLGYLCGDRGEGLFDTLWTRLLDAPAHTLHDQAFLASQQGWLEYRHTGMVTEISFRHLLRQVNEE